MGRIAEAQTRVSQFVPNTGLAVAIDIGDTADIHPKNKQDVGKRLGLWALAKVYGRKVVYSGPVYRSMKVEGGKSAFRSTMSAGTGCAGRTGGKGFAIRRCGRKIRLGGREN